MAKIPSDGPMKIDNDHCNRLRASIKRLKEELAKEKKTEQRRRLREQIRLLTTQLVEDCTDAKIVPSEDR
jgi:hypothetical protein